MDLQLRRTALMLVLGEGGGRLAEGAADVGLEDRIEGMQVREMEAFEKTKVVGRGLPRWH